MNHNDDMQPKLNSQLENIFAKAKDVSLTASEKAAIFNAVKNTMGDRLSPILPDLEKPSDSLALPVS